MIRARQSRHGRVDVVRREENLRRLPTTRGFAALDDHARLPWRFFGRFTASAIAALTGA